MGGFEILFKTLVLLGLLGGALYVLYRIGQVVFFAGVAFLGSIAWLFEGDKLDTIRRLLYLLIIIGFVASIYFFGFAWWMIPVAIIALIASGVIHENPSRRHALMDGLITLRRWSIGLCALILVSTVIYYFFSDVSISEVGISGVFLGLWNAVLGIGKIILSIIGIIVFIAIFGKALTGSTVQERGARSTDEVMEENLRESGGKRW